MALYGEGRFAEARSEFALVVAADPEDDIALHYLGLTAQAQGDVEAARSYYERALALDPDGSDLKFDLGTALLEQGEVERARGLFDEILESQPQRARAHLYAGIADYRLRNYSESLDHLDRAEELDPGLARDTRYYVGLCYSFLGSYTLASGAFESVEEQSPLHPLGRSASELRRQALAVKARRPWTLGFTTGAEWDTNPLVIGDGSVGAGSLSAPKSEWRGVFRANASYALIEAEKFQLAAGYDGYVSLHEDSKQVDLQTHLAWARVTTFLDPVRIDLRYDYSYTFLDLTDDFRSLHRLVPSFSIRQGGWGLGQLFYQLQDKNYFPKDLGLLPPLVAALDRDGYQHSLGFNQFFFAVDPFDQLWVGALGDWNRPKGTEFEYSGFELAGGAELRPVQRIFPELSLSFDYRFVYRDYANASEFPSPGKRQDRIHRVTWSLAHPIGEKLEVSFAGSFRRCASGEAVACSPRDARVLRGPGPVLFGFCFRPQCFGLDGPGRCEPAAAIGDRLRGSQSHHTDRGRGHEWDLDRVRGGGARPARDSAASALGL